MIPIADGAMQAVEYALDGLETRFDVRAHNVANANTPGFRASRVEFEAALRDAVGNGRTETLPAPAVLPGVGLPNANGNTVNLESELPGLMKDRLLQEAMVNAYNFKVGLLRTAITGR